MGCLRNGKMIPYDADIYVGICEDKNTWNKLLDYKKNN